MRKVNISEAKTRLSQLVEAAAAGDDIVIAKAGRPVARLTRLERKASKRRLGLLDGRFRIPEDFNRPLSEEVVRSFEGG